MPPLSRRRTRSLLVAAVLGAAVTATSACGSPGSLWGGSDVSDHHTTSSAAAPDGSGDVGSSGGGSDVVVQPVTLPSANGYFTLPGAASTPAAPFNDLSAVDVCGTAAEQLTLSQEAAAKKPPFAQWTLLTFATLTQISDSSAVSGCTATLQPQDSSGARADLTLVLRSEASYPTLASFVSATSTAPTDPVTASPLGLTAVTGLATDLGKSSSGGRAIGGVVSSSATGLDARYWLGPHVTLAVHLALHNGGPSEASMISGAESLARRFVSGPIPQQRSASTVRLEDLGPVCLTVAVPTAMRGTPASSVALHWDGSHGTCTWTYGATAHPSSLGVTLTADGDQVTPSTTPAGATTSTDKTTRTAAAQLLQGVKVTLAGRTLTS